MPEKASTSLKKRAHHNTVVDSCVCVCCPWSLSVRVCSCLTSLTVGYQCDCVHSWSSRRPGVWSPADPHTRTAMIGGRLAQQHSSAVGVVPWSPSRPVRVPCPGWRRMASTPPGPPACVACVGSSRMGPQDPRSGPLVAILGRDPQPRLELDLSDYWLVTTQGRSPRSRPPWSRPTAST